jgi:hypothetical protein
MTRAVESKAVRTLYMYNATIIVCARSRNARRAVIGVRQMEEATVAEPRLAPDACPAVANHAGAGQADGDCLPPHAESILRNPSILERTQTAAGTRRRYGDQWQQAPELLTMMLQSGLTPNVFTYSAAISAREKCEHWQQALGPFWW